MTTCLLSSGYQCKGTACPWWDTKTHACSEEPNQSKYCSHLDSFCQYRRTEFCPNNHSRAHNLKPPGCKRKAHENVERSLSEEDKRR